MCWLRLTRARRPAAVRTSDRVAVPGRDRRWRAAPAGPALMIGDQPVRRAGECGDNDDDQIRVIAPVHGRARASPAAMPGKDRLATRAARAVARELGSWGPGSPTRPPPRPRPPTPARPCCYHDAGSSEGEVGPPVIRPTASPGRPRATCRAGGASTGRAGRRCRRDVRRFGPVSCRPCGSAACPRAGAGKTCEWRSAARNAATSRGGSDVVRGHPPLEAVAAGRHCSEPRSAVELAARCTLERAGDPW